MVYANADLMTTYLSRVHGLSVPTISVIIGTMNAVIVILVIPFSALVDRMKSRPGANGTKVRKILALLLYNAIIVFLLGVTMFNIQCQMRISLVMLVINCGLALIAAGKCLRIKYIYTFPPETTRSNCQIIPRLYK